MLTKYLYKYLVLKKVGGNLKVFRSRFVGTFEVSSTLRSQVVFRRRLEGFKSLWRTFAE